MAFVDQIKLMDQFVKYMEFDRGEPFSDSEKKNLKGGLCLGLAIVHSYMAATQKLNWWHALLEKIAEWDGSEESLKKAIKLPDENLKKTETEKTLGFHFKRALNYAFFHQVSLELISDFKIDGLSQKTLLQLSDTDNNIQWFESEKGEKISYRAAVGGVFSKNHLFQLLQPEVFSLPNTIFSIHYEGHTCSIRFDKTSSQWCLYDPNFRAGEKKFSDIDSLHEAITGQYGSSFSIQIASFNQDAQEKCKPFENAYSALCENSDALIQLIDDRGFIVLLVQLEKTELIKRILTESNTNEKMRNALIKAMRGIIFKNDIYCCVGEIIVRENIYSGKLLALAKKYPDVGAAITSAFSVWFGRETDFLVKNFKKTKLFDFAPTFLFSVSQLDAGSKELKITAYNKNNNMEFSNVGKYVFSEFEKDSRDIIKFVLERKLFSSINNNIENTNSYAAMVIQELQKAFEKCKVDLKACSKKTDKRKLLSEKYDEIIHLKKINGNSTPAEKLESLKFQLMYKLTNYERRFNQKDDRGFSSGIFGMYFSAQAKWNGTKRMIIAIEESLKSDPPCVIDENKFRPAEKNGTLGQLFLEMKKINKELMTHTASAQRKP